MKAILPAAVCVILVVIPGMALAEGVPMKPGKWEMKTTIEMPMLPQPKVSTTTDCIRKTQLSPGDMMNQDRQQGCTVSDVAVSGNTVRWKVECPSPEGSMRGEGEVTSNGTSVDGKSRMTANIQGRMMIFKTTWSGRRIGECD